MEQVQLWGVIMTCKFCQGSGFVPDDILKEFIYCPKGCFSPYKLHWKQINSEYFILERYPGKSFDTLHKMQKFANYERYHLESQGS